MQQGFENQENEEVKTKSFVSRNCAHKYATNQMKKSSAKKPIRATTKINK
jgi:hypothetical protein